MKEIAKTTGVDFNPAPQIAAADTHELKRLRIGLYQRYYGGNVDEGWTRWILEDFGFNSVNVFDPEKIHDVATFEKPNQLSVGMEYVLVNGVPVIAGGKATNVLPGKVLRGPGFGK